MTLDCYFVLISCTYALLLNTIVLFGHQLQSETVEKVQRRFTKQLHGLRNVSYCDSLNQLKLHTLELRRLHLDFLFCYKVVFGLVSVNFTDFFQFSVTSTRGHKYKLFKPRCTSSLRQKFFVDRVISVWNALPSTVNFSKLSVFRSRLFEFSYW